MVAMHVVSASLAVKNENLSMSMAGIGSVPIHMCGKRTVEVTLVCNVDASDKEALAELQCLLDDRNLIVNLSQRATPVRQNFFEGEMPSYEPKPNYLNVQDPDVPEASKGSETW